ncbi:MAG: hypothetical protein LBC39_03015 [Methanobrevibacter sp.]|jgi:hypothetical protein|nr:hypothetical protein [Candidatus Methanovirga aequatorialis]
MDNTENLDEELKLEEIKRLSKINSFNTSHPELEPNMGLLTDDEILKYAGKSVTASRIRLKRDVGDFSDKFKLHKKNLFYIWLFLGFMGSLFGRTVGGLIAFLFALGIPTVYTAYVLYLKDYAEIEIKNRVENNNETGKRFNSVKKDSLKNESVNNKNIDGIWLFKSSYSFKNYEDQINELESLYETKEKIARGLIEKRFTPPQITYDRFISAIDNCNGIFYSHVESTLNLINMDVIHSQKLEDEIKNRVYILKSLIEKIDELTNEMAINSSSSDEESYHDKVKNLMAEMKNLTGSVKEYK